MSLKSINQSKWRNIGIHNVEKLKQTICKIPTKKSRDSSHFIAIFHMKNIQHKRFWSQEIAKRALTRKFDRL